MSMSWEEIKQLKLPEPKYIKITVSFIPSRKIRRHLKTEWTPFVCPKDVNGGACYTCTRRT